MDEITRQRHEDLFEAWERADYALPTCQTLLVQTSVVTTYPSTSGAYFAVQEVRPGGTETEGGAGSYTAATPKFYAAIFFGTTAPPQGTKLLVHLCGTRYVGRYDG